MRRGFDRGVGHGAVSMRSRALRALATLCMVLSAVLLASSAAMSAARDFGTTSSPGKLLSGRSMALRPGEKLTFSVAETSSRGLGSITATPSGKLAIKSHPRPATNLVEYSIEAVADAQPGRVRIQTSGKAGQKADRNRAFAFEVRILPKTPAAGAVVLESSDWYSWVDTMPPGPPSFHLTGTVTVPTPGHTCELRKASPQGINPAVLITDLVVTKKPGAWPAVQTAFGVRYDESPFAGNYDKVVIRHPDGSIVAIPVEHVW